MELERENDEMTEDDMRRMIPECACAIETCVSFDESCRGALRRRVLAAPARSREESSGRPVGCMCVPAARPSFRRMCLQADEVPLWERH